LQLRLPAEPELPAVSLHGQDPDSTPAEVSAVVFSGALNCLKQP
jgi:hypothetical protein